MKKIIPIIVLFLLMLASCQQSEERKLLKEIVIGHSVTDSVYRRHGTMKEIYRIYNCEYNEVNYIDARTPDILH